MKLTSVTVKNFKIPADKKKAKLTDGQGLYLLATPSSKYWKYDYRYAGKRKTLHIGTFPAVSLKGARSARDNAKRHLFNNIDPSQQKQKEKREATAKAQAATFEGVAIEWLEKKATTWTAGYTKDTQNRLKQNITPWIGSLKITDIKATDLLTALRKVEKRGAIETAHKLRAICSQIFNYAILTSRLTTNPARDLQGALTPSRTQNRAAITEPKKAGELMRAIQAFKGTFVVQCALMMSPYVFVRPTELRHAEWSEINLESNEWRIPAHKMKMKQVHVVPLSIQVVTILDSLRPYTGGGKYVFPSIRTMDCKTNQKPMSENTINVTLRRLGFNKSEMCAHGFRGMASTLLHEQGFNSDIIERQLAHKEGNAIKAAYNHARHLPERTKLMQHYANYLDALRDGADVIPLHKKAC